MPLRRSRHRDRSLRSERCRRQRPQRRPNPVDGRRRIRRSRRPCSLWRAPTAASRRLRGSSASTAIRSCIGSVAPRPSSASTLAAPTMRWRSCVALRSLPSQPDVVAPRGRGPLCTLQGPHLSGAFMAVKDLAGALKLAEDRNLRFVSLQFTDIVGAVKSVQVPMHQLEEAVEHGKWFDGSSIEGFARIAESDMFLVPDLSTFSPIPWEQGIGPDGVKLETGAARVICDVYTPNGDPFPGDPRWVLRRQMERARKLGYTFNTGPELEFFLLRREEAGDVGTLPHDSAGYFDLSADLATEVRKEMMNDLEEIGIEVETAHHEVAAGQHEIDFKYADALRTADNAVTFKTTLKAVAGRHGLHATFMPKPIFGINGSGMHTHQSLWDGKKGKNAFAD